MDPKTIQTWAPLLVILVVFALRYRNLNRPRPLRVGLLWIAPAFILILFGLMVITIPPTPQGWLAIAVGVALGAAVGWKRGYLLHLERDPASGKVMMRQSPAALFFVIAILVVKRGLSMQFGADSGSASGAHPPAVAMVLSDGLIGFAFGMVLMMRWTLWQRARALPAIPERAV